MVAQRGRGVLESEGQGLEPALQITDTVEKYRGVQDGVFNTVSTDKGVGVGKSNRDAYTVAVAPL